MSGIFVDIDRILLNDLDVTPDRVERIRDMVEVELQCLLDKEGLGDCLTSIDVTSLSAPMFQLSGSKSDSHVANSVAQCVVRALRNIG
jgi:hypothetical protein